MDSIDLTGGINVNRHQTVSYSGVSHGSWCNTKTYRTKCQYCRKRVFYFSCDHGCKVFFDALGDPWPLHYCEEYHEQSNYTSGDRVHAKLSFIETRRHRRNETISIEVSDINQKRLGSSI